MSEERVYTLIGCAVCGIGIRPSDALKCGNCGKLFCEDCYDEDCEDEAQDSAAGGGDGE
jgi:hypothetical protein